MILQDLNSVDVVIPTYNETSRLARAVESVLAQTIPVRKIIIVDDGSSDNTICFLRAEAAKHSQICLIELEHCGHPGILRKEGLRLATAEWVAFLDSDDVWFMEKIEKQLNRASETKAAAVYGNAVKVIDTVTQPFQPEEKVPDVATSGNLLKRNFVVNSSVIAKRSALISIGLYADAPGVRGAEDYATWLRLASDHAFVGIPDPVVEYHVTSSSLSKRAPVSARRRAISDWMRWVLGSSKPTLEKIRSVCLASAAILWEQRNIASLSIRDWLSKR